MTTGVDDRNGGGEDEPIREEEGASKNDGDATEPESENSPSSRGEEGDNADTRNDAKPVETRPSDPEKPARPESDRTVFMPPDRVAEEATRMPLSPKSRDAAPISESSSSARTVVGGIAGIGGAMENEAGQGDVPRTQIAIGAGSSGKSGRQIQVGDVLNHIFEVRRFIARGGMGEVFEGVNVNTQERVAIKAILPHLAADAAVHAMFLKEARTLTKLNHPGLVQYRVLAQEPELGALYIVTDYVDGANLSDRLGQIQAGPEEVKALLSRLAGALRTAHDLGAIHRDISPDNIMLEGGDLARAKIIDFGIAKDLDPGGQTIVGDGFAGKLNYVAPEQLGDFGRDIGPWTDIYSLALTILSLLRGRDVDMGATLVEAVDRRRAGVDLSDIADADLRSVLEAMLQPDPKERPNSMDEVIDLVGAPAITSFSLLGLGEDGSKVDASVFEKAKAWVSANPIATIGSATVVLLILLALVFLLPGDEEKAVDEDIAGKDAAPVAPPDNPAEAARTAIDTQIRKLPCSWLDIVDLSAEGNDVALQLRGVSGKSAEALDRIEGTLKRIGLNASSIDFSAVSPIQANTCRPLEAFLHIRSEGAQRLAARQDKFEMSVLPKSAGDDAAGKLGAQAVITLDLSDMTDNVTLVGMDETGKMDQFAPSRAMIEKYGEKMGDGVYRFTLNTTHSGWSGILMLTGQGPFPESLLTSDSQTRGSDWPERFLQMARAQNWKSEMVWYRTVDELAN